MSFSWARGIQSVQTLFRSKCHGRRLWPYTVIMLHGLMCGLPQGMMGSLLQAWLVQEGASKLMIGQLAPLAALPFSLKFFWAPLCERPLWRRLGLRRSWVMLMQIGLLVAGWAMAQMHPVEHFSMLCGLLIILAFCAATQDIVIDAWRMELIPSEDYAYGATLYTFGYRMAMIVSGGIFMILADQWGFDILYQLWALLNLLWITLNFFAPDPQKETAQKKNWLQLFIDPFGELLRRPPKALLIFVVIMAFRVPDVMAQAFMTMFLKEQGYTLTQIGVAFKIIGVWVMFPGMAFAGWFLKRYRLWKSLWVILFLQGLSNLFYVLLSACAPHFELLLGVMAIEYFFSGMATSGLMALMMQVTHPHYRVAQFAVISAITQIARAWIPPLAGYCLDTYNVGWGSYFFVSAIIALPVMILWWFLKDTIFALEAHKEA